MSPTTPSATPSAPAPCLRTASAAPTASARPTWRRTSRPAGWPTAGDQAAPPPRPPSRRRSGTWTAPGCSPHGLGQVVSLAGQVEVVLGHPRRLVAHQMGQRLDVHPADDRRGAELVPHPVERRRRVDALTPPAALE